MRDVLRQKILMIKLFVLKQSKLQYLNLSASASFRQKRSPCLMEMFNKRDGSHAWNPSARYLTGHSARRTGAAFIMCFYCKHTKTQITVTIITTIYWKQEERSLHVGSEFDPSADVSAGEFICRVTRRLQAAREVKRVSRYRGVTGLIVCSRSV